MSSADRQHTPTGAARTGHSDRAEPVEAPDWKRWGAAAALLLTVLAAFSGYQKRAFDSYVHMFFADHYLRGWFDLWEPRWYGGFSVVSYPPLAHQLLALLAVPLGHEPAFVLLNAAAMIAIPFAVGAATKAFTDTPTSQLAIVIAVLFPTAHRFAYVYGQLAMLVATPFALFAIHALDEFLRKGGGRRFLLFVALVGSTAGAHHVSTIFAAIGCGIVGLKHLVDRPLGGGRFAGVWRSALAAFGAASAIGLVILPFWRFASGEPQAEIPHISRMPLWERPLGVEVIEQVGIILFSIAALGWALKRRHIGLILLAAGTLFLGILSTGTTTPLPRWLFGSQWRWLTYDKFHHWSALFVSALLASVLARFSPRRGVTALAVVLLPFSLLNVGHKSSDALQPEFIRDIGPMLKVLRQPDAHRFRHLTLGFGDQFCRLDIYGNSPNIDGDYHTARRDPRLRQSGMATLDASKYYPAGPDLLRQVFAEAESNSLRWVFTYDEWYYPFLLEAGFELKEVWRNGVTLFEREDVDPLPVLERSPRTAWSYLWGVLPLGCFMFALALTLSIARAPRPTSTSPAPAPSAG